MNARSIALKGSWVGHEQGLMKKMTLLMLCIFFRCGEKIKEKPNYLQLGHGNALPDTWASAHFFASQSIFRRLATRRKYNYKKRTCNF